MGFIWLPFIFWCEGREQGRNSRTKLAACGCLSEKVRPGDVLIFLFWVRARTDKLAPGGCLAASIILFYHQLQIVPPYIYIEGEILE
jgi:hypothetical protein